MRRAGTSIPANIAEGFKSRADKVRVLNIAQGSLEESRYYLILSRELDYADITSLHQQLEEVSKLLEGYIRQLSAAKARLLTPEFWLLNCAPQNGIVGLATQ